MTRQCLNCGQSFFVAIGACPTCFPPPEIVQPTHEEYLLHRYPDLAPKISRLKAVPTPPTVEQAPETQESAAARHQLMMSEGKA